MPAPCARRSRMSSKPTTDSSSGHDAAAAVRRVEDADGDQVRRGHDARSAARRSVEERVEGGLAAGHRVRDVLDVAVADAAEPFGHELDEGVDGAAGCRRADCPLTKAIRSWPRPTRCSSPAKMPGVVVDVDRRELERAGALPERDDRDDRVAEVLEEPGLVLHVAEQHDRVAVPGLEDRRSARSPPRAGRGRDRGRRCSRWPSPRRREPRSRPRRTGR